MAFLKSLLKKFLIICPNLIWVLELDLGFLISFFFSIIFPLVFLLLPPSMSTIGLRIIDSTRVIVFFVFPYKHIAFFFPWQLFWAQKTLLKNDTLNCKMKTPIANVQYESHIRKNSKCRLINDEDDWKLIRSHCVDLLMELNPTFWLICASLKLFNTFCSKLSEAKQPSRPNLLSSEPDN